MPRKARKRQRELVAVTYISGALMLVAVVVGLSIVAMRGQNRAVSDFSSCVAAGYPVAESFPRSCRSADGSVFTEVLDDGPALSSYTACGCGCCGGAVPLEQCLFRSRGDDLRQVAADDRALLGPNCENAGCSIGVTYRYCD